MQSNALRNEQLKRHSKGKKNADKPFIPIYKKLFESYKEDILSFRPAPGSRVDSINEIQKKHNVARETAKLVLKLLAEQEYIIQKPGKGSFVADLRPRRKIWGVVLPFYSVQYEYLLEQMAARAWKMGREFRHFVDYGNPEDETSLVAKLINERFEAVVVVPTQNERETSDFYGRLTAQGTFVALIDHTMAGSYFPYVIQSYDLGVQRGMRYLLEKTDSCIAFVRNEVWEDRNDVQSMMEETYKQIMVDERPDHEPLVIDRLNQMDAILVHDRNITGVFCCDDTDAIRIIGRLHEQDVRVPEHVALVSYGNTELARFFTPAITSIDPHSEEMAQTMAGIIEKKIKSEATDLCQYVVQPDLIVRDT